ncbi:MAG: hypothetical protein E6380_02995 [Franconibacter helveticus]|nr:hypothetical protein [Franconibacter helveticus]
MTIATLFAELIATSGVFQRRNKYRRGRETDRVSEKAFQFVCHAGLRASHAFIRATALAIAFALRHYYRPVHPQRQPFRRYQLTESERRFFWPDGRHPDDHPGLSDHGF